MVFVYYSILLTLRTMSMEDYLNVYVHALASYRGVNEEDVEGWLACHESDPMKYPMKYT